MTQWRRFKEDARGTLTTEEVEAEDFSKPSGELQKILRRKVSNEEALRVLIESYPEILPWKDWDPDSKPKFLVLCRGQKHCATDLVLLEYWPGEEEETEARFVIVETKLASNHEINREVVGQVLEYRAKMVAAVQVAAALTSSGQENLRVRAEQYWGESERKLDDVGKEAIGQNWEDIFKQALAAAQEGDIRLVIASDEVPASLATTIASLPAELLLSSVEVQVHGNTAISEKTSRSGSLKDPAQAWKTRLRVEVVELRLPKGAEVVRSKTMASDTSPQRAKISEEDFWTSIQGLGAAANSAAKDLAVYARKELGLKVVPGQSSIGYQLPPDLSIFRIGHSGKIRVGIKETAIENGVKIVERYYNRLDKLMVKTGSGYVQPLAKLKVGQFKEALKAFVEELRANAAKAA